MFDCIEKEVVVDYTTEVSGCHLDNCFNEVIAVHGKGRNVLALGRVQRTQRLDGKWASYKLMDLTLTCQCQRQTDQAFVCVLGDDWQFLQRKELDSVLKGLDRGKSLFDFFSC